MLGLLLILMFLCRGEFGFELWVLFFCLYFGCFGVLLGVCLLVVMYTCAWVDTFVSMFVRYTFGLPLHIGWHGMAHWNVDMDGRYG